ncbi:hypothetical protein J3D46_003223 [Paenarthrobacter sp. A20]|nr:hypothetical protein [Paenarthrobacter sp. A20]
MNSRSSTADDRHQSMPIGRGEQGYLWSFRVSSIFHYPGIFRTIQSLHSLMLYHHHTYLYFNGQLSNSGAGWGGIEALFVQFLWLGQLFVASVTA